jgi:hypothetical protein
LVVLVGVDGEFAEELAGDGVDDADVEVGDEQDDVGSGVGSSDADVVEFSVDAQGDGSSLVDAVVPDQVVGLGVARVSGHRLRHRVVAGVWCPMNRAVMTRPAFDMPEHQGPTGCRLCLEACVADVLNQHPVSPTEKLQKEGLPPRRKTLFLLRGAEGAGVWETS